MNIDYTLLVDETGFDGSSKKVAYAGCLVDSSALESIEKQVTMFNQDSLDNPALSHKVGFVNSINEARHFADDHLKIHDAFVDSVVSQVPCRVYAALRDANPSGSSVDLKKELLTKLIELVKATRRVDTLTVIAESSPDDKALESDGIIFKDKSYLALSVADYYAAILHQFHERRLSLLDTGKPTTRFNSPVIHHYQMLMDKISLEFDISTGEKSSRSDGYYFWDQIKSIIIVD